MLDLKNVSKAIQNYVDFVGINYHNPYLSNTVNIIKSYNNYISDLKHLHKLLIVNNNVKIKFDNNIFDYDYLYNHFIQNNELIISNENSNHTFMSTNDIIISRCIHDYIHYTSKRDKNINTNFNFTGEILTYKESLKYFTKNSYSALFSEVVSQVCYYFYYNDFPSLQKCVDYSELVNLETLNLTNKGLKMFETIKNNNIILSK